MTRTAPQLRGRTLRAAEWMLRLAMLALLLGVWQWWATRSESLTIASFTDSASGLRELVTGNELWPALWRSNLCVVVGYPIAVVTAVPFGLWMARSPIVGRLATPQLVLLMALPLAPLVPVMILAFGLGLLPRVVIVLLFSWVFIALNARTGGRAVDTALVDMARSYGCSRWEIWRKILLPSATPAIMAGLRIGAARAIEGMVVAELLMVASGLGGLLLTYRGQFQPEMVFAIVVVLIVEALVVVAVMRAIEDRTVAWARAE